MEILLPDQSLLSKLKGQADKYYKLYKENKHWEISKSELEKWHLETSNLGDELIPIEDVIAHKELSNFKDGKTSIYDSQKYAVNIKHNMKNVLNSFYKIFSILFKKLHGKAYPEKLPNIV